MATTSAHRDERLILSTPAIQRALVKAAVRAQKMAVALGVSKAKRPARAKGVSR